MHEPQDKLFGLASGNPVTVLPPPSPQRAPTSWASTLSSYCDGAYSMAIHILPIHRYILLVRYAVPQLLMGYYSVGMACSTATADMLLFCW